MKAFILAAGLGTRLQSYTANRPKALVELNGMTLLEHALAKVSELDIQEVVINVHHFGDQIIHFLQEHQNFGKTIVISDERDRLLDTGGALLKAAPILEEDHEPFLVYNVDVLTSLDLNEMLRFHRQNHFLATMAVRNRKTDRQLMFDDQWVLSGWINRQTGEERITRKVDMYRQFAYSGIQWIDPKLLSMIHERGKFSIIDLYLRLSNANSIGGFLDESPFWMDLGKPEQLLAAEKLLSNPSASPGNLR
ncbi:MAG: nucleotidyltransferase family protein [Marinilabiliales bacterium]|nr:nucleotidyltransferase family protein [Marinilabiliales bacterium]